MDIILFDDDEVFLSKLFEIFNDTLYKLNLSHFQIVLHTSNKQDIVNYLHNSSYHALYVLDIVAGNRLVGYEICQLIKANSLNNHVLFITDYPSYILYNSKYKLIALNVILKKSKYFNSEIESVLKYINRFSTDDFFYIKNKSIGTIKIYFNDIYYFEKIKSSHNVCVFHADGYTIFTSSLNSILKDLDNRFIQVHYSFIVNINKIKKIDTKNKLIILEDNTYCPYSYKYKKDIEKCLILK